MSNIPKILRGLMRAELRHLYERLADIEAQMLELRALLAARLDTHERYHQDNEHRWGLAAWCHRYPFRMLALAAALGLALIGRWRDPLLAWLLQAFQGLL